MCGPIHTHTSFVFVLPYIPWLFPFLPPFTTPFSINHDYLPHKLSRIFLCFYNIQGVASVPLESEPPQKYLPRGKEWLGGWVIEWWSLTKGEGQINHVIKSTALEGKWHSHSNLSTSYGSRLRHIYRAQVWVVSCVLYSCAITALEFLLMSQGFNYFLSLRDEQNSKCGAVLAVIKCIYLPLTYLCFRQDIEDRCLLLMSSMSFVDLPFQ
jgi:hypothetical protein